MLLIELALANAHAGAIGVESQRWRACAGSLPSRISFAAAHDLPLPGLRGRYALVPSASTLFI